MKNSLMKKNDIIIRILEEKEDKVFVIDCIKLTMPDWYEKSAFDGFEKCAEEVISEPKDLNSKRIMHERFTLIAGILPFVSDKKMRNEMISKIAEQSNISKQTIRKYLCLYLAYQDITVLAPNKKKLEKELTQDEKNMRWALNKFFYTRHKNSLKTAYTMMLKEKYCNSMGELVEEYPSFYQFRYFYRKTRKMQNHYGNTAQSSPM